jgi:hypothetical protein
MERESSVVKKEREYGKLTRILPATALVAVRP